MPKVVEFVEETHDAFGYVDTILARRKLARRNLAPRNDTRRRKTPDHAREHPAPPPAKVLQAAAGRAKACTQVHPGPALGEQPAAVGQADPIRGPALHLHDLANFREADIEGDAH